ncbi:MAG TPA: hypothetical protein VK028_14035, partial [Micromonosporaceae bacterium]|nr:hypothetical protein [Micromonosporaceae bacterium]
MAAIEPGDLAITVHLPGWEAMATRHSALTIPHAAITHVSVSDGWPTGSFGLRHGGVVVSGVIKVGVWLDHDGARRLVSIRRGMPTLQVWCDAGQVEGFALVMVGTHDAHTVAERLRKR